MIIIIRHDVDFSASLTITSFFVPLVSARNSAWFFAFTLTLVVFFVIYDNGNSGGANLGECQCFPGNVFAFGTGVNEVFRDFRKLPGPNWRRGKGGCSTWPTVIGATRTGARTIGTARSLWLPDITTWARPLLLRILFTKFGQTILGTLRGWSSGSPWGSWALLLEI